MHRLFVAVRPPEPIRDLLIDAMDDSADFRWQLDEQLHLTLRFIGEVERPVADDVAAALSRVHVEPMELHIAGVGRFEQRSGGANGWFGISEKITAVMFSPPNPLCRPRLCTSTRVPAVQCFRCANFVLTS